LGQQQPETIISGERLVSNGKQSLSDILLTHPKPFSMRNTQCLAARGTKINITFAKYASTKFVVRNVVYVLIAMRALR
jgi:hypothetical protein